MRDLLDYVARLLLVGASLSALVFCCVLGYRLAESIAGRL